MALINVYISFSSEIVAIPPPTGMEHNVMIEPSAGDSKQQSSSNHRKGNPVSYLLF